MNEGLLLLLAVSALAITGVMLLGRGARRATATLPPLPVRRPPAEAERALDFSPAEMLSAFESWLADCDVDGDLWRSFDQLIRELTTEQLQASRVRCYHVRPGAAHLIPLGREERPESEGPSSRAGLLGHVVAQGREYVAGDPTQGPLVTNLAAECDTPWMWIWPVIDEGRPVGLLAVSNLQDPTLLARPGRRSLGRLCSLFWRHVSCRQRLLVAQRTDLASGVLTRHDFFTLAADALGDSYAANEPLVMGVLALEGLRRLDDTGRWEVRDELVQRIGQLLARRVRSDDLVGRFADDRFVVLMRRLDSALGKLVAEKMLAAAEGLLTEAGVTDADIRLRFGLAGSGFAQPALPDLLVSAFSAVERARKQGLALDTDLSADGPHGAPA